MCDHGHSKLNNKIFISIASLLDPLLENTIENMLATAKYPENLVFGIIIQDKQPVIDAFAKKYGKRENFKIISILPEESKGCCWARAQVQMLMSDEMYFMQTDSHHVYVKHWDTISIQMLDQCVQQSNHSKVVLSTYGTPAILPEFKCTHEDTGMYMKCERFYNIPKVRYVPHSIKKGLTKPQLWHTISAHYLFTYNQWVHDVPYDPELYFDGEEDTLALRSYTRGYDIYYPHAKISYHFYTRKGEKRHSDVDKEWYKINDASIKRMTDILKGKIKGKFGLGTERSLDDYKDFTQIDYINKVILTPETHVFGNIKFVKKGFEWTENDQYKFKELENSDEFFLIYDYNRKLYGKLDKQKRTFHVSQDLVKWEIIGPSNKNVNILVYGETTFTKDLQTKSWTETNVNDERTWKFKELENLKDHFTIFDESRNITLRLHKDLSCYEASWPPENKYVALYGVAKKPVIVSPKSTTPKPLKPQNYYFGYSHLHKDDINSTLWSEFCENKKQTYQFNEILNNKDFYVLQDNKRNLIYRLHKNLKSLDIQIHDKSWVELYNNGSTELKQKQTEPQRALPEKPMVETKQCIDEKVDNSISINRNSDVSIVCFGSSDTVYYDLVKSNHIRYTRYHKYNYFYYDKHEMYNSSILKNHTKGAKYILSISTKTVFSKLKTTITSIGKHINANVFCTTFDDTTIQNHAILFKLITAGTSTYFDVFDKTMYLKSKPDGVNVISRDKLASSFQYHNKSCFSLVLHVMEPDEIKVQVQKVNKLIGL